MWKPARNRTRAHTPTNGLEPSEGLWAMLQALELAYVHVTQTCTTCGCPIANPTPGCAGCGVERLVIGGPVARAADRPDTPPASREMRATPSSYPNYDVEGLPDARYDGMGAVYNTGKIRALKPNGTTGSNPTPSGLHRPPVLASEVLREDLRPHEPGTVAARRTGAACGAALVLLGVATLGWSSAGVSVVVLGAALLGTALMPIAYGFRATIQVGLATALVAGSTVAKVLSNADVRPGLVVPVVVLATGLLFRSWHRASRHARMVVAAGIVLSAAWLGWSESVDAVLGADPPWQTWVPGALRLALAPVLLVALLAFMGEATTGGCAVWAASALVWYGLVSASEALIAAFPANGAATSIASLQQAIVGAQAITALAAPVLALAVAQLVVVAASEPEPSSSAQRPT